MDPHGQPVNFPLDTTRKRRAVAEHLQVHGYAAVHLDCDRAEAAMRSLAHLHNIHYDSGRGCFYWNGRSWEREQTLGVVQGSKMHLKPVADGTYAVVSGVKEFSHHNAGEILHVAELGRHALEEGFVAAHPAD